MKLNKKQGISLIVLVITIIVMIILAAAIILSLSSSGIIGKAGQAQKQSDYANAKQVVSLAQGNWLLDEEKLSEDYGNSFGEYAESELKKAGYAITDEITDDKLKPGSYEVTDDGTIYVYPIVPEEFVASKIATEDQVSEGLVIYELTSSETTIADWTTTATGKTYPKVQAERNQFVWVPVDDINDFKITGRPTEYAQTPCLYSEPYESGYETEVAEYNAMKASVEKYGGFYIARYEAGKGENNTAVSKKDATVWNVINWGTSMTEIGEEGAVYRARQMYNSYNSIASTLCYGVQWETIINFMKDVPNPNVPGKKYIEDSTGMGVFTGIPENGPAKTGSSDKYKVKNIYDMAGNVAEWTMEAITYVPDGEIGDTCRISRGDSYYSTSGTIKWISDSGYTLPCFGFRVALYLK